MNAKNLIVGLSIVAGAGCGGGNISGMLGADRFGDTSNPPAERGDAMAMLTDACLSPSAAPSAEPTFARTPYLQRATDADVSVLWVSPSGAVPSLVITTPAGTLVGEDAAVPDASARLAAGQTQWVVPVVGLAPDTVYCYQVRQGDTASPRTGFRTAPAAGAGLPVRFIAFGDSGSRTSDQQALLAQMQTVPFDFMIHTGDIAYDSGTRAELQQNFFDVYAPFLRDFPVFPASGNHDYETDDAAPFREAFDLPDDGAPDGAERWYSYDWGDVHFVTLDTERTGPVQAAWLEQDLAANQRPWTIVYGHKPPFSSGEHGSDGAFQQYFVPVIERHHVQLVLSGHDHDYERTVPQNGVTYVVTGGGGRGVREMGSSSFTAFADAVIHFVYVTVAGDELALHAIDGLGEEFDSAIIRR